MNRQIASNWTRQELDKHNLKDWHVRLTTDPDKPFLGLCVHKDKSIILNAHHIDLHPEAEILNTIRHEVAHALTEGHGHDDVWSDKAREIGCDNTLPCSHLSLPPSVIDGIRSGAQIELTIEEETQVIRTPKFKVTRLQEKCPTCGKIAKETKTVDVNNIKLIFLECGHFIKRELPKETPFETFISNGFEDDVIKCKHEWVKNQCSKCNQYKLYNFQIEGAKRAEQALSIQKGFGIFDDMGLGKTIQALALIKYHPELTPTLFIVKSAVKFQFFKQILTWLGPSYLPQIIDTSRDYIFPNWKCYIISYDLLRRFPSEHPLKNIGFKLIILDECQQIKNPDSTRTQEVRKLVNSSECKVIGLSGTPWKNRGGEFFPILNMLSPTKFYSYAAFLNRWVTFYWEGNKKKQGGIQSVAAFKEYVKELLIRREYNEVMDEFPDINRMKFDIKMDETSQQTYDSEVSDFVAWYNQATIDGMEDSLNGIELLGRMARMRHIAGLAKIPSTIEFIEDFIEETDRKLVIFVHHKDVGEILLKELKSRVHNIPIMTLNAEMKDDERYYAQEKFNNYDRAILVGSTLASGEGINLQTCSDCIMHERQWNPQNEDQAAPGRFRRIGQKASAINITFMQAEGSIDEHIDSIVESKRRAFHEVMNKGEMPVWNEGGFAQELANRIVKKFNKGK